MRVISNSLWALLVIAILIRPSISTARTWDIQPDGTGDAPTIQAGVDSAAVGDTVLLHSGIYFEWGIELTPGVNLVGEFPEQPENVVIDGQQLGRVMQCVGYSDEFVIEGLTITGGLAMGSEPSDRWGGALLAVNMRATIRNCAFRGNSALPYGQGGAVFIQDWWEPSFVDCSFDSNSADYGGAIRIYDNARPPFDGCRFNDNYAQSKGGAVYIHDSVNVGSSAYFTDCSFVGNHAVRDGGAMWASYATAEFTSCLFADNRTTYAPYYAKGGALYIDSNALLLRSCTFVGNSARVGAAIFAFNVHWQMHNVLVTDNDCEWGAVYPANFNNTYSITCNDFYGNSGGDWIDYLAPYLGTDGNISSDPLLCDGVSPDQSYHLQSGSPCLPEQSQCGLIGLFGEGCATSGIGDGITVLSSPLALVCRPNPFNPQTTISFSNDQSQRVRVEVYDIRGRLIAVLTDQQYQAGEHSVEWQGRDSSGRAVPSGEYFFRVEIGDRVETRKAMLLR